MFVVVDGLLHGIDGPHIGGSYYDVTFARGSYEEVYTNNGLLPTFWNDETKADLAAMVISEVLDDNPEFGRGPKSIAGCKLPNRVCALAVPKYVDEIFGTMYWSRIVVVEGGRNTTRSDTLQDFGTTMNALTLFEPSEAPLPAPAWLFLSALSALGGLGGLGGLGIIKRVRH